MPPVGSGEGPGPLFRLPQHLAKKWLSWLAWRSLLDDSWWREGAYDEVVPDWTPFERAFLSVAGASLSGDCRREVRRPAALWPALVSPLLLTSTYNWSAHIQHIDATHAIVRIGVAVDSMLETAYALRNFCAMVRSEKCEHVLGTWASAWCRFRRRVAKAARSLFGAERHAPTVLGRSMVEFVEEAFPRALVLLIAGMANGKLGLQEARNVVEHFLVVFFEFTERVEILGKERLIYGRNRVASAEFHPEAADARYDEGLLHRADVLLWLLERAGPEPRMAELGVDVADCSEKLLSSTLNITWLGVDAYGSVSDPGPEEGEGPRWLLEARRRLWPWLGTPRAHLVIGDSAAAARSLAGGPSLDLVFVDGDHSEKGAARDLAAWAPLVRPGGVVAGHDYSREFPGVVEAAHAALPAGATLHMAPDSVFWWYAPDPAHPPDADGRAL